MGRLKEIFDWVKLKGWDVNAEDAQTLATIISSDEPGANPRVGAQDFQLDAYNHNKKAISELYANNEALTKQIAELTALHQKTIDDMQKRIDDLLTASAEKDKRDQEALNILKQEQENRLKLDQESKIDALINEAIKAGKIPPENKELQDKYRVLATTDIDATKAAIDAIPVVQNNVQNLQGSGTSVPAAPVYSKDMPIESYVQGIEVK